MYEALAKRVAELEEQVRWLLTRQASADRKLEPMYTVKETADLLRCCTKTVKRQLMRLEVPHRYLRLGTSRIRHRMIFESEVRLLLEKTNGKGSRWDQNLGHTEATGDGLGERRIA